MKAKITLKPLIVITCLLLSFSMTAQDVPPITLHVETAGTLPSLIAANRKYQITNLTLTGNLNSIDIRYLREMAGRTYDDKPTNGKLSILNLSGANIVSYRPSGGNSRQTCYFNTSSHHHTENNIISVYMFQNCTSLTDVTIPNSVTTIGGRAFYGCTSLTSITIPNSVTTIEAGAFQGCKSLINITIPNSVTTIGTGAFRDCTSLTSITIPNSVTTIEQSAFYGCTDLASITIPNSVTTIGTGAFQGCTSLTSVTIGNSVTTIVGYAFRDCTSLTSVTIGNSVTTIEQYAFSGCTSLKEVVVSEGNTQCSSIDGVLFNKNKNTLIFYPNAKPASYTIPNSVTTIVAGAFQGCTSLTEIHNNNPVPQTINSNVFYNVNGSTCKLYVPKGSYNAYWNAPTWWRFENIIESNVTSNDFTNNKSITISNTSNGVCIKTDKSISVSIFNLSGQKVYEAKIQGAENINLNKGIYVVRVGNESQKIVIR